MAKFFIHRPVFAIVIAIIISLIGIIAGLNTPIAQYPNISPPMINVSAYYTGANASVVNQSVAQIIEQQVNGTQGMDYMTSNSNDDGSYSLSVYFEVGSDGDMDSVKVQNNVSAANSNWPETVIASGVTTAKSSQDMSMIFAFYCDNGLYDTSFVKNYADIYIADNLKRVKGVGQVQVMSADYALRIWINPEKLANFGLTVADVQSAIRTQNAQAAAGAIGKLPVAQGQEKEYTGQIQGRLEKPEQFENIILKTGDAGAFVRLKDVARVEIGQKSNTYIGKFNGHTAVPFIINLTSDANALETIGEVKRILKEAEKNLPEGIKYGQVLDSTEFIQASINEVAHTFFEALVLVVLVIFIFLQSFRATLIPLLAVPVSLLGTFAAFTVLDFTINTLTLFAMVLAIGLVVDDAIVVIENVEQHMERGLNPVEATEVAMAEVQGPVVAIAFVLSAVFIPIAFLGGMTGILYRQFALTIAVSMGLSAFVALTLTPALCALILKPHEHGKKNFFSKFFDAFNNWFDRTKNSYVGIVAKVIAGTKFAVIFLLIVCGVTGLLYKVLPSTFVPDEDQGYFIGAVMMPEGTSLNRTSMTTDKVAAALREQVPGVKDVITIAGYNVVSGGTKSSASTLFLSMYPWADRKEVEKSASSAIQNVFLVGNRVAPESLVVGFNPPALTGLGAVGGLTMQLIDLESHSDQDLADITNKIVMAANSRPELQGVDTSFSVTSPSYKYDIDQEQIEMLGVQLSDVYNALQVNFGGMQVDDYDRFGRTYKVVMQSDVYFRGEVDMLKFMFVKGSGGQIVPLDTLISYKMNTGTTQVTRFNGKRSVLIQGQPAEGYSSGQAMAALTEVVYQVAPTGFGIEWSGQSREEFKASGSTGQVMALALVFVFLCLAALYESWSVPFSVLMTVPTGIFGALLSEFVLNYYTNNFGVGNPGFQNSIYMQIGVIMIMGLAAKNAILIVEFAKMRTDKGMEAVKASLESAGLRLRPILMTSFAFIIGCLPLATATGAGSAARNSMGVAVVGGMTVATFLGIFLIPVFFVVVQKIVEKIFGSSKAKTPITEAKEQTN
ncbi:MAG: multidrug efflux RND transporter permease subunit [Selenomonadaceae bacterium]|nr:multidrug efflux RND transporter permease subunit [Selenomonadaceae bacterium]